MSFPPAAVPGILRRGRVLAVAAVVLLAAAGGGLYWYLGPHRDGTRFSAMFTESIGIYPGSDVRILGVAVGSVDAVLPEGRDVEIDMHLDRGVSVRADTRAVIIAPSLVSDRYVQLTGVYDHGPKLANGAQIPLARTATPVEIDDLSQSVVALTRALGPNGANRNGALADLLRVSAANLQGNGPAIKQMIDQFGQASATLAGSKKDLFKTLDNLAEFTATLASDDGSVRGLNTSLSAVTRVLADDRRSFAAALHQLSGALGTVKGFIDRNRGLISSNVRKLAVITETLTKERDSLAQALRAAPMAIDNLLNTYDPQHNVLVGRGDLNELSLWPSGGESAPPALLPAAGATTVSGGH